MAKIGFIFDQDVNNDKIVCNLKEFCRRPTGRACRLFCLDAPGRYIIGARTIELKMEYKKSELRDYFKYDVDLYKKHLHFDDRCFCAFVTQQK